MRVDINMTDGCVFPKLCPCCMGAANQVETIRGSSPQGVYDVTTSLEVPVCTACLAHRREGWRPALTIVGIGAALFLLALLLSGLADPDPGSIVDIVSWVLGTSFILSLVLAVVAYFWTRWRWPRSNSPHVRAGKAVKVAPGGIVNWVHFDFANEQYGRLFKEMNSSRLTGIGVAGKADS